MATPSLLAPDDVHAAVHYDELEYSNPHHQVVHPRWTGGKVV